VTGDIAPYYHSAITILDQRRSERALRPAEITKLPLQRIGQVVQADARQQDAFNDASLSDEQKARFNAPWGRGRIPPKQPLTFFIGSVFGTNLPCDQRRRMTEIEE